MAQSYYITHDFLTQLPGDFDLESETVQDKRHYAYVYNPVYTTQMYLNYLKFVYVLYNKSRALCPNVHSPAVYMIQLGFLPVVFPPSFWGDKLHLAVLPKLKEIGLPYFTRKASSVLDDKYNSPFPDLWVSKLDAAELCNCQPHETTVEGVLKKCGL